MIKNKDLIVFLMARFNVNSPDEITQEMMDGVTRLIITTGRNPFLDNDPELYMDSVITNTFKDFHDLDGFSKLNTLIISGLNPCAIFYVPSSINQLYALNCENCILKLQGHTYFLKKDITFGYRKMAPQKSAL